MNDQKYNLLCKNIFNNVNTLLHGPGGTGKSFMINKFYEENIKNLNIAKTALTGIAALNIQGTTIHSFLGVGVCNKNIDSLVKKNKNTKVEKKLRKIDLLIVDEISMMGKKTFLYIDEYLKKLLESDKLWGGINLLFVGDFYQLPPVKDDWLFNSPLFNLEIIHLTDSKRYDNNEWYNTLLRLRKGIIDINTIKKLNERVGIKLSKNGVKPTKLYCKNINVDFYNNKKLEQLDSDSFELFSKDYLLDEKEKIIDDEQKINQYSYIFDNLAPKSVKLKKGAQVMITYNIDVGCGLVNGTRCVVEEIKGDIVYVKLRNGTLTIINSVTVKTKHDNLIFQRKFMPLKLAYCLTIHKSQGLTLDMAEIDLKDVFVCGQAYVALSRVKNLESLSIKYFRQSNFTVDKKVKKKFN